jgi:hypothetical protein
MGWEHSAGHDEETPAAPALLDSLVVTRTLRGGATLLLLLLDAPHHHHPAEQQHRTLGSEEAHPLVWFFNTTVLLFAVGTTCYAVRRSGCLGIYGPWHEDDLAAPAADWRESDATLACRGHALLECQLLRPPDEETLSKDPPDVREKKLRRWMGHPDCHMVCTFRRSVD